MLIRDSEQYQRTHYTEYTENKANFSIHPTGIFYVLNNHTQKSGDFGNTWLYNHILAPILGLFQIETIYLYYMLIK